MGGTTNTTPSTTANLANGGSDEIYVRTAEMNSLAAGRRTKCKVIDLLSGVAQIFQPKAGASPHQSGELLRNAVLVSGGHNFALWTLICCSSFRHERKADVRYFTGARSSLLGFAEPRRAGR